MFPALFPHGRLRARSVRRLSYPFVVLFLLTLVSPRHVTAQASYETRTHAAALYDQAVASYRARDYAPAARKFEEANRLMPSQIALGQAVRSYRLAGEVQKAGTLALRLLQQEGVSPQVRAIAEDAAAVARRGFLRLEVSCTSSCSIAIDGADAEGTRFFVPASRDVIVVATFDDAQPERRTVRGGVGEIFLLSITHTLGDPTQPPQVAATDATELDDAADGDGENPYRISKYRFFSRPRATFFAVLVPTILTAGMLTWSAADARTSRNDVRYQTQIGDPTSLAVAEHEHHRDVTRTKWIAVECGAFVLGTAFIAAFTDWTPHGDRRRATTANVSVGRGNASLELRHRF